jgi:hypothetical protein
MSMRKAEPPADGFHEELYRRNKERVLRGWSELVKRHTFPKRERAKDLAVLVRVRQMLESQEPKLRGGIPADMFPMVWDIVQIHKRQILQAELECDAAFLRRLTDAVILVKARKAPGLLDNLRATGYALAAWRQLYDELGHPPGRPQLREYFEVLRRQDGKNVKISDRQWARTLNDLRPLFRRGE